MSHSASLQSPQHDGRNKQMKQIMEISDMEMLWIRVVGEQKVKTARYSFKENSTKEMTFGLEL